MTGETTELVLVFAPREGDARGLCHSLAQAGLASHVLASADDLSARLDASDSGALLLTEDALTAPVVDRLSESLEGQPLWSDLPVVVLASGGQDTPAVARLRSACNLVRLDGPALVPTMESALRARRRQVEVRDRMAELKARASGGRSDAAQDEFVSWVSHELQTPVSAILLWSRMIASGIVQAHDLPRALASIESSARTQSYQINDLLDASRLAAGTLRLGLEAGPLAPAVQAAVQVARSQAEGKKVGLVLSLDPSTGPALADPERVQRVVWNLLTVAIRTTVAGGEVRVELGPDEASVRITVASSGDDPAASAGPSPHDHHPGLRRCHDLVELQGGTLETAPPGPDRGVVFTLRLPAAAPSR